ncbi:sensor histidine kinase [Anaerosporobacter sp.]|uniref:sensor histidine kinase n=1 Tax=Anaerosporobacter sp. TaxID=1872529 RepID=UPI00286F07F0|nr:HAMP domain-containing sensor histidine kinase [Anaerosporobacter sp.]
MKRIKYSLTVKWVIQLGLAVFGFLLLLCFYHIFHYPDYYGSNDEKFTETYYFEKTFAKYNERVAAYVMYRENKYTTTFPTEEEFPTTHINETFFMNELVSDQDKFEYYNQILNVNDSNFIYYVKNLTTGAEYYSPNFVSETYISPYAPTTTVTSTVKTNTSESLESSEESVAFENSLDMPSLLQENTSDFMKNISKCDAYLVLNTNSTIYNTNVIKWGLLDSRTLEWMSTCVKTQLSLPSSSNDSTDSETSVDNTADVAVRTEKEDDYVFYTATINDFPYSGDDFSPAYHSFQTMHQSYKAAILYLPIIFIVFLAFLILGVQFAGYGKRSKSLYLLAYDKINTETAAVLSLVTFLFLLNSLFELINSKFSDENEYFLRLFGIYIAMYPIFIYNFFSIVRRVKCNTLRSNMLLIRIGNCIHIWLQEFFAYKELTYQATAIWVILFTLTLIIALSFKLPAFTFLAIILLCILFLIFGKYFLHAIVSLSFLIKETKKISDGDFTHKINEEEILPGIRVLSRYINDISNGLSDAMDEKLKSERLKTELITNVSHDIKTPLTSIINYVDLLKKEPLDNETALQYIEVLDAKAQRLKTLIEDLVEASKASSGAITLHMQKINLVELMKQTIGEFEDRLAQNDLEIDLTDVEEPLYIYADGRSTFRILENTLSNVNKYALHGTRVYIDLEATEEHVSVSVKNISATKLNISADELMERFVRGDLSRNTEGTGLGLSIAQSLASLQNATFDIVLDGDLFKAIVTFPRIY